MTALPPPAGPSSPLLQIWQSQGPAAAAARAIDDGHLVLHGSQGASLLAVDRFASRIWWMECVGDGACG